jgi:PIN domain nuclease of toxin-antitoxin system
VSDVLLDTHVLLWWQLDDERLSAVARDLLADEERRAFVSAASAYEIALKAAHGHLHLPSPATRWFPRRIRDNGFMVLAVSSRHALRAGSLPPSTAIRSTDCWVAQAREERLAIVTADPMIARYDVETIG